MTFTDEEVVIEPGHETRHWQSCNYTARGQRLFHERAYLRSRPPGQRTPITPAQAMWLASGPDLSTEQWLPGGGTKAEMEALAAKHGGRAYEEFYAEEGADAYFLAFRDTDKALAFCRTEDFDRLCLTMEKLPT
jgi:hypothetical protein